MRFHYLFLAITIIIQLSCSRESKNGTENKRPNIIVFMVDDMGWQDTSLPFWENKTGFNNFYRTPNMVRLAEEGMKFTQAYATSVCSPSRISFMTGMNAAHHRVTNWTLHKNTTHNMELNHKKLIFPEWHVNGLSMDTTTERAIHATTLPEVLRRSGYLTIHAGKAHFGAIDTPGEDPLNLGFDINIAGHAAGAPKSYLGEQNFGNIPEFQNSPWPVPGLENYHGDSIFLTEVLTREALKALDSARNNTDPFYLYMSHYAVHTPIMADKRFISNYDTANVHPTEVAYATMVEGMDKSLGDIIDYLEENSLVDNTVILFMSDNGGLSAVARGGEKHTHNKPLSSGKGSAHEGGTREPMIVKWPGKISPGSTNDSYLIIEDFFPTIIDIASVENPELIQDIDGKSFIKTFNGAKINENRPLIWHYPNEWGPTGPGIGATSSIRQGDWKLIYYHLTGDFELFNLKEDIGEQNNLAESNPQKLKELAGVLTEELKKHKAQMPAFRESGERVPWPDEAI